MKILIYGINFSPELTGVGKYTGEMASWLAKSDEVKVITSFPYYPEWRIRYKGNTKWYVTEKVDDVSVHRCPLYVPSEPTTIKRIIHLISFAFTSFFKLVTTIKWKPDVIIVVEPSILCTPGALLLGWVCQAKTILHIQDYELDAMLGLKMAKNGSLLKVANKLESWIMRRFDHVTSISDSMLQKANDKGVDSERLLLFPNWVDIDFVTPSASEPNYRKKWGFRDEQRLVLYSGNIGKKQGLEIVIEAAEYFKGQPNIQFLIVGEGANKTELQGQAAKKKLQNVHFKDLVSYSELPNLLSMADIHLVIQKKGAADVVLPSKLTSILAAGGFSIITAELDTELGKLTEHHPGIAERVEPEKAEALIVALIKLMKEDTKKVNFLARRYAEECLSKRFILNSFRKFLYKICGLQIDDVTSLK